MYINTLMRLYISDFPLTDTTRGTIALEVSLDMTTIQLKNLILQKYGIPINKFYLNYGGKIMNDNQTLASCNITDNSFLRFSIRNIGN